MIMTSYILQSRHMRPCTLVLLRQSNLRLTPNVLLLPYEDVWDFQF